MTGLAGSGHDRRKSLQGRGMICAVVYLSCRVFFLCSLRLSDTVREVNKSVVWEL